MVKNLPANAEAAGDEGSIPGSGRSPGGWQFTPVFLPGKSHTEEPSELQSMRLLRVGHH